MLDYKVVDAKEKDIDILTSIKLVTMIDDEMDKVLSYAEKSKIRKSVDKNIERTCELYTNGLSSKMQIKQLAPTPQNE